MTMLLKRLGIVADTADNGRIAVGIILLGAREPYQIGSMDNLMPEMVGTIESFLLLYK